MRIWQRSLPRPAALRWFAGVYFLVLGTSILIMPQGSFGPWLGAVGLRAAATFASGLLLLWLTVVAPPPAVARGLHALAALPHLVMGVEYATLGAYTPAFTLLLLAAGVLAAPFLPEGATEEGQRPEALGLALGLALAVQGADMLGRPQGAVMVPAALGVPPGLVGALFLGGGLAVVLAQLAPAPPAWALRGAHLLAGGVLLGLWAAQSWLQAPIYWALGAAVVVRGVALLTLPWWGPWAAALDVRALRVRLALAIITAVLVPLAIVLPVVLGAVEGRRVELSLERQRQSAVMAAAVIGELARDHRGLLGTLAADPRLRAGAQAQQGALAAALEADGRLAALALYDAGGGLLAGAGAAPPTLAGPLAGAGDETQSAALGPPWAARPTIGQARALRDAQGRPAGVLVAVADPDALAAALRVDAEAAGAVALVNAGGEPLVVAGAAPTDLGPLLARGAALGADGPGGEAVEHRDGPRLLGGAPIAGLPWRAVAVVEQTATLADLTPLRQLAFAATLITALVGGAAGWWLAGQLTRPIDRLVLSVGRIADGDLTAPLPEHGPSELSRLSGAVGVMAGALDARLAERERLVGQLQAQNQELRDLEEAREESIRALSHDLRTPLTAISGNAQRLARVLAGGADEKGARMARAIVASGQRMNVMIQDLADAMRVDAGDLPLRREAVALPLLVERLSAELDAPEEARIRLVADGELPPVEADPGLVDRVLTNLLNNAIKYSPPGAPVVVRMEAVGGEVVVAVADQGIGMTPEEQARLFSRYYRAEGARAISAGLGLGLYVTRALVEAHGGRIWVESAPGAGSTFFFTLPAAAAGLERTA